MSERDERAPALHDGGSPATAPAAPAAAAGVFGTLLPAAERYVARLAGDGVTRDRKSVV